MGTFKVLTSDFFKTFFNFNESVYLCSELTTRTYGLNRIQYRLDIFHHNARYDVCGFIPLVSGIAEMAIDLPHLEHVDRIRRFRF